jgi:hypothetical protein
VNCFTHRTVEQFPSGSVPFVVFAILTDGLGEMSLEVRAPGFVGGDLPNHAFRSVHESSSVRPCTLRIRDCSFPVAGHYQVTLLAGNELVAQRKLVILEKEASS